MARYFMLFCMKRGGQHGVIHWICSQARPSVHYNNNEYRSKGKQKGSLILGKATVYPESGGREPDSEPHDVNSYNLVLCNFEDRTLGQYKDRLIKEYEGKDLTFIVLLRDPYNLYASRKKDKKSWKADVYKEHMTQYCEPDVVGINFNKWFASKIYRKKLAKRLGIKFTDEGINKGEHPYASKSAFDKDKFRNNAQQKKVLERYKHVAEVYKHKFGNGVVEFAKEHFDLEIQE